MLSVTIDIPHYNPKPSITILTINAVYYDERFGWKRTSYICIKMAPYNGHSQLR